MATVSAVRDVSLLQKEELGHLQDPEKDVYDVMYSVTLLRKFQIKVYYVPRI